VSASNPIYVVQHNHLDPTWRRCWDRTLGYETYQDQEESVRRRRSKPCEASPSIRRRLLAHQCESADYTR
jgi:hypothetical protein